MAWIEGERREHRADPLAEIVLQEFPNLRRVFLRVDDLDLLLAQDRTQHIVSATRDLVHHGLGSDPNHRQALAGDEAVWRRHVVPGPALPRQRGDPHHEKFVEIVRGNCQEFDPFEQRVRVGPRLREHPFVECEPAQLPVNVQRRIRKIGIVGHAAHIIRPAAPTDDVKALRPSCKFGVTFQERYVGSKTRSRPSPDL